VGKDYMCGLREGLGDHADNMIVAEASLEVTDPKVDSQIVTLKASGADTFFIFSSAKPAAQAIRKVWDVGWRPFQFVGNPAASVATVMKPAGLEKLVGIISAVSLKDPTDSHWQNDPGLKEWLDFMKQYYPEGDVTDLYNVYAYAMAQTLVQVLLQCGDDLTRENLTAGSQPEKRGAAHSHPRNSNQHGAAGLLAHGADAIAALRRQAMCAVWGQHHAVRPRFLGLSVTHARSPTRSPRTPPPSHPQSLRSRLDRG
jgi:hypothetical protein